MKTLALIAPLALLGCQVHPTSFVDAITPETISVGITAPNAINGPTSAMPDGPHYQQARQSSFGTVGITFSATYRLKPLRIERAEVQPVQIVRPSPTPLPIPLLHGNPKE